MRELIEKYPESAIVNYVRLAFAHSLSRPFRDFRIGKVRKAEPKAALEQLTKVNIKNLPDYLKVRKMVSESNSLKLLGKSREADFVLREAKIITEKKPSLRLLIEQALEGP